MIWQKMTQESAMKRLQAEILFSQGLGPHKVSRLLAVNFYTVRDWKTQWREKNSESTPSEGSHELRSKADILFSEGLGYRKVARRLNVKRWTARDWSRRFNRGKRILNTVPAKKAKQSCKKTSAEASSKKLLSKKEARYGK